MILITGAAGFLGKYVTKFFQNEGLKIIPTDIKISEGIRNLCVTNFSQIDSFIKKNRPEVVIHLAALTGATGKGGGFESLKSPFEYFQVNVLGVLNIFEACRKNNIKKIIYMSSFSSYGITFDAITEETPLNPNNPYGFSKVCGELIARNYATNYDIKTIIFRAPLLCGEGQKEINALREFVIACTKNEPIVIWGKGSHLREWVHPEDAANAFFKATEFIKKMKNPYEIFILGNKPISMKSLAEKTVKIVGKGSIQFLNQEKIVFDQYTNTKKIKTILDWEPKITVEAIIRRVIADLSNSS